MTALPVIAFFIFAPPHHWSDSLNVGRGKCGLMTTSALSTVQILEFLWSSCGVYVRGDGVRESTSLAGRNKAPSFYGSTTISL